MEDSGSPSATTPPTASSSTQSNTLADHITGNPASVCADNHQMDDVIAGIIVDSTDGLQQLVANIEYARTQPGAASLSTVVLHGNSGDRMSVAQAIARKTYGQYVTIDPNNFRQGSPTEYVDQHIRALVHRIENNQDPKVVILNGVDNFLIHENANVANQRAIRLSALLAMLHNCRNGLLIGTAHGQNVSDTISSLFQRVVQVQDFNVAARYGLLMEFRNRLLSPRVAFENCNSCFIRQIAEAAPGNSLSGLQQIVDSAFRSARDENPEGTGHVVVNRNHFLRAVQLPIEISWWQRNGSYITKPALVALDCVKWLGIVTLGSLAAGSIRDRLQRGRSQYDEDSDGNSSSGARTGQSTRASRLAASRQELQTMIQAMQEDSATRCSEMMKQLTTYN